MVFLYEKWTVIKSFTIEKMRGAEIYVCMVVIRVNLTL